MKQYDVVIVGAGVVGSTLALSLAQQGLTVALVDQKKTLSTQANPAVGQVSAINQDSKQWFEDLGIWPQINAYQPGYYQFMQVWEDSGQIAFDSSMTEHDPLGYIVANNWILHALGEAILQHRQIAYLPDQQPAMLHHMADSRVLTLEGGQHLRASLVIGADGGNSWVRQQQQFGVVTASYGQTAIVGQVATSKPHFNTAWQRFLPTGPLAFLPMSDQHQCSIVWSCDKQFAAHLLSLNSQGFTQELSQVSQYCLGELELLTERKSFPLVMRHARQYVKPRVALVGDAIHTIHPLAGLGLNLGLKDAHCLSECITQAYQNQQDIGESRCLQRYQRERLQANLAIIATMQGFKSLFGNQQGWLKALRNWGLKQTDRYALLKRFIISRANHL